MIFYTDNLYRRLLDQVCTPGADELITVITSTKIKEIFFKKTYKM